MNGFRYTLVFVILVAIFAPTGWAESSAAYTCNPTVGTVNELVSKTHFTTGPVLVELSAEPSGTVYGDCGEFGIDPAHTTQSYSERTFDMKGILTSEKGNEYNVHTTLIARSEKGIMTLSTYAFSSADDMKKTIDYFESQPAFETYLQSSPKIDSPVFTLYGSTIQIVDADGSGGMEIYLPGSNPPINDQLTATTGIIYDGLPATLNWKGKTSIDLSSLGLSFEKIELASSAPPLMVDDEVDPVAEESTEVITPDVEVDEEMESTSESENTLPAENVPTSQIEETVVPAPESRSFVDSIVNWFRGLLGWN
ncbi:MAG: hypothetical protein AABX02_05475 [archaeon]